MHRDTLFSRPDKQFFGGVALTFDLIEGDL